MIDDTSQRAAMVGNVFGDCTLSVAESQCYGYCTLVLVRDLPNDVTGCRRAYLLIFIFVSL